MDTIHMPHTFGEAHAVKASEHFLWIYEADEVVGQDVLDDQAYHLDCLSSYGLAHLELVNNEAVTGLGGQLHDGNGHLFLWSKEWSHADDLACDVGDQLGDDIHEGGLANVEGLDPLFIVPGLQNDLLPPVGSGGAGPESVHDGLGVVPECLGIHGVLCDLVLISTIVSSC
ncbi:hypothetical protein Y1Q_0010685 [Alligator mississippiensis]|uniref:Uncharacterized protein n=1 Tax=Alligator mississippiensis TaxID=8496 RepID=A0A151M6H7_ALLMI|nr:hypothetical protein Y1Q_0010685 [Alligator mississippiensis]